MARFTLSLITWMNHTNENQGKIELKMIDTEAKGTKGNKDPSVKS